MHRGRIKNPFGAHSLPRWIYDSSCFFPFFLVSVSFPLFLFCFFFVFYFVFFLFCFCTGFFCVLVEVVLSFLFFFFTLSCHEYGTNAESNCKWEISFYRRFILARSDFLLPNRVVYCVSRENVCEYFQIEEVAIMVEQRFPNVGSSIFIERQKLISIHAIQSLIWEN